MTLLRFPLAIALVLFASALMRAENNAAATSRTDVVLEDGWRTIATESGATPPARVEFSDCDDRAWRLVDVPHNWDAYEGYRQVRHGDKHGTAWYRRTFTLDAAQLGPSTNSGQARRVFLFFEGVGSYATVWVNGREVGRHAGGLTTFTLDVTDAVVPGRENLLVVRAEHPNGIRDLPWVCGGSERTTGFSEGPQPFGIFRPVHVVTTGFVRIEPFGIHVWSDEESVHVRTELKNYDARARIVTLTSRVRDRDGALVVETRDIVTLAAGSTNVIARDSRIEKPRPWSPGDPHLYTIESAVTADGESALLDRDTATFGIRTIRWPAADDKDGRFFLNGVPIFINGTCDYEHLLGGNFAFSPEQIHARVRMIESAGFNAFRDAHHPHNLRFQEYWDRDGLLWWTQFGAHIWFDNDAFRANFKTLLRDWVKERRNSPSLVLWGLQNESLLPADFARECVAIIRELDPTASSQRKITTCNGGSGTDWDVPQNWTGTYGGDPEKYADDLRKQRLVGEYGAWRSLGLHSEPAPPPVVVAAEITRPADATAQQTPPRDPGGYAAFASGPLSEERETSLLETKVRLAESVRGEVAGHFQWIFSTHANPGRSFGEQGEQLFDGIRELDQIGPANNKGLFTIWGEPTDAYYMYRANYAPRTTQPMVHIVSHTNVDRWIAPGRRSGVVVFSNCDEVELFNDLHARSLGVRKRGAIGTHFTWDDVEIATKILYAEGRVGGKTVATDCIVLHHLPVAPEFAKRKAAEPDILAPARGRSYLYRVNCGGPEYVDTHGNHWSADREYAFGDSWGSTSWARQFQNVPPLLGSQRKTHVPISGTRDDALFQTFRYGRDQLRYAFSVPDGNYEIELFFAEPWYGGETGWRLFDVAVNGDTKITNLDLASDAGGARAITKKITAQAKGGWLEISFPRVNAGEAVISAIAISAPRAPAGFSPHATSFVEKLSVDDTAHANLFSHRTHLDNGDRLYGDAAATVYAVPTSLLEADWIQTGNSARTFAGKELMRFVVTTQCDIFVAHDARIAAKPAWLAGWDRSGIRLFSTQSILPGFEVLQKRFDAGATVVLGPNNDTPLSEGAMYFVMAKRVAPVPAAELISDLSLANDAEWRTAGHLKAGQTQYGDRTSTFVSIPPALSDSDWIRTVHDEATSIEGSFTARDHLEVFVALDARITTPPAWMADWISTNLSLTTNDRSAGKFSLWKKRFTPGQRVPLGPNASLADGNAAAMYTVIARQVRPSQIYAPVVLDATRTEWTITVGVGDRYGLNFRFRNPGGVAVAATLEIVQADGSTLRSDPLTFPATTKVDSWDVLRARTGSSINAGTYRFRVTAPEGGALMFDTLEVE